MNRIHFDVAISPSMKTKRKSMHQDSCYNCIFCSKVFKNSYNLEIHVNNDHEDIISPEQGAKNDKNRTSISHSCPVCNIFTCASVDELTQHVELHFNAFEYSPTIPDISSDRLLAEELYKNDQERIFSKQLELEHSPTIPDISSDRLLAEELYKNDQERIFSKQLELEHSPTIPDISSDRLLAEELYKNDQERIFSKQLELEHSPTIPDISSDRLLAEELYKNDQERIFSKQLELEHSPKIPDVTSDRLLAEELFKKDQERILSEQREFQLLQAQYGMNDAGNFKEQSIQNMQKAVYSGELTVSDFYEKQNDLKMSEVCGIDDGSSCVKNIIPAIKAKSEKSVNVSHTYLCSDMDFYSSSYGDKGWGCGYRNLQMLISCLLRNKISHHLLLKQLGQEFETEKTPNNALPSVSKLQNLIEWAWNEGFDVEGRDQLDGKLKNTRKWIGATEVTTLLSSLRFRCELIDIDSPNDSGLHTRMFEWILNYFSVSSSFKPPLYLQHHGHSRTVIGVEVLQDGEVILLIVDPNTSCHHMEKLVSKSNSGNSLKFLRKSLHNMKFDKYQITAVIGIVTSEQEYQNNKVLVSKKICNENIKEKSFESL